MVNRTDGPERFVTASFSDQGPARSIRIPTYASMTTVNPVYVAVILSRSSGSLMAGLYVNRGARWVFSLPQEDVGLAFGGDYTVQIVVNPNTTVVLASDTVVYRNGYQTTDAVQPRQRDTVWVLLVPKVATTGSSGGDTFYEHNQNQAVATWIIEHNLNKFPSVTTFDSTGDEVEGIVRHLSKNISQVMFSAAIAGRAFLN